MQNTIQKFRQSSIVFEKPGILSENLKTLTSSNVYRRMCGTFFLSFRSWVICKNLKRPGFYTLVFYTFINNSRSKQNKKNSTHSFVGITK